MPNQETELTSSSPADVRAWLSSHHPKQLSMLDKFEIELRLGRLSTSSTATARHSSSASSLDPNNDTNNTKNYTSPHYLGRPSGSNRRLVTFRTVELLRSLIGSTKWRNGAQLMLLLKGLGRELHSSGGFREPAIGNVVRRIMSCVREEVASQSLIEEEEEKQVEALSRELSRMDTNPSTSSMNSSMNSVSRSKVVSFAAGADSGERGGGGGLRRNLSLASMLWAHPQHVSTKRGGSTGSGANQLRKKRSESFASVDSDGGGGTASASLDNLDSLPSIFHANRPELRQAVMEAIQEVVSELEDLHTNINAQAPSHIHADEIILTYARSKTVEMFLKAAAAKNRKFQVVICEGAPHFGGHAMAKSLAASNIDTTVINDSATFAIMARVNKVLLPAHAVLANGGLIAPSGSHMVALAANQNSVPVVSVTGMFKLCPQYPHEGQDTLNDLVSPSSVVDYAEMSDFVMSQVEYINPVHDYIPPQLINLYVTNIGGFQPSYIYRLLAEYYHSDDWESFE